MSETKNLIECESCPEKVSEGKLNTITTSKGKMLVCSKCAAAHFQGIKLESKSEKNQIPEVFPASRKVQENPEATNYLQTHVSRVSNPEEVPHPVTKKKLTQSELFKEFLLDEQVKIEELFSNNEPSIAYAKLEERIAMIESIAFEAKTRASEGLKKKRELDALSGKNRWDKERREENKLNNSDPRTSPLLSQAQKEKKKALTKLESVVQGFITIGMDDDAIMAMCESQKFKGIEVREAIQKLR